LGLGGFVAGIIQAEKGLSKEDKENNG